MQSVQCIQSAAQAPLIPNSQKQACDVRIPRLDLGIANILSRAVIEMPPDCNAVDRGFAEAQAVELV